MISSRPTTERATGGWRKRLLSIRRTLIFSASLFIIVTSYVAAFSLRADFSVPTEWWPKLLESLPFLIAARLYAFRQYNLLHGWWKHAGVSEFVDIVKAVLVSSAIFATVVVLLFGVYAVPRSVVLIDGMFLTALLAGSRLVSRGILRWERGRPSGPVQRAILVGDLAGVAPALREILKDYDLAIQPLGVIDLSGRSTGLRLHGVPVLGGEDDLSQVLVAEAAETVLLAISGRDGATLRRVLSKCDRAGVAFKIVPSLRQVIGERPRLSDLRDVDVDDVLGRHQARLDVEGLRDTLCGRRVLITGAAGSIGSELARQVAAYGPQEIVLLDRNEQALASLETEIHDRFSDLRFFPLLCDIRNRDSIREIFASHRPDLVYHAAAYKHVPMMEMNPIEAVKNNVLGTRDLIEASDRFGVTKFVLISTDKAIQPINIMGLTKRVAERLLESATSRGCCKIAVRFGNVFGSEGSVVPILLRQIRDGGPVTLTHPEATRYFMTIPEAVQLVLQASALGTGGELFVLDMGEPVRILDLATSLIRLAGLRPEKDIEIRITGLRPGERLHEVTLIDEATEPTSCEKIWMRRANGGSSSLAETVSFVEELIQRNDEREVLAWLRREGGARVSPRSSA